MELMIPTEGEPMNTDFLTADDVAELIKVRKQTLAVWRIKGQGPTFIKAGRAVRYRRSDVDRWLDGRAMKHTSLALAATD